jgi:hypothetical protein
MPTSSVMDHVSRPLLAVLVATAAFFALWVVALKPSSSSTTGRSGGPGAYQSAIDQAHRAVTTANAASAAEGGQVAATPAPGAVARREAAPGTHIARVGRVAGAPLLVARALASRKVLALLFLNSAAPDDQAVKQELAAVPTHSGRVVKLALPLSQLASYAVVTGQVPVTVSPTLVLIGRNRQASTIVGFADRFEIAQRVADALR